jgi:predicted 3-demethylubiquinone-9 3-methyltransferase (glyoxalase superfamily)
MNKLTPFLWFNDNAEAAMDFYLSVFPSARKLGELRTTSAGPGPAGTLLVVELEIEGQQVTFLNGGPQNQLSPAFSFLVRCETQEEIDSLWEKLLDGGGSEVACGWLTDRFGLSWQVIPTCLFETVSTPGGMTAMMGMKKLDIAALKAAAGKEK